MRQETLNYKALDHRDNWENVRDKSQSYHKIAFALSASRKVESEDAYLLSQECIHVLI
jgi:hypothetical protein